MNNIGERVQKIMAVKNMSSRALASASGVKVRKINKILAGKRTPDFEELAKLVIVLGDEETLEAISK